MCDVSNLVHRELSEPGFVFVILLVCVYKYFDQVCPHTNQGITFTFMNSILEITY